MEEMVWNEGSEEGDELFEEIEDGEEVDEVEEEDEDEEEEEDLATIYVTRLVEEVIAIEAGSNVSVEQLKDAIRWGSSAEEISLDFEGITLQNDLPLSAYDIESEDSLHYITTYKAKYREWLYFYVKTPTEVLPIVLTKYHYLKNLWQKIFEMTGIPVKQQRIMFDVRLRTDPLEKMDIYGHGATLDLYLPELLNVTICTVGDKNEYPLMFEDFNTGLEVKKKIFDVLLIPPSAQRVLVNGILVEDDVLIREYNVSNQSVLYIHENTDSGTRIKFLVKTPSGETVDIETHRLKSVYSVKLRIQDSEGIPIEEQRLFLKDTELLDWQSLGEAKVLNDYKLDLYLRCKVPLTLNLIDENDELSKKFRMKFDIRDRVEYLMDAFEKTFGICTEKQWVTYESDSNYLRKGYTLAYYGIESESEINLKKR